MRTLLAILLVVSAVCFGQMTYVYGDISFEEPFNPDNYTDASIRVSETGNWNNILAWGYTDAESYWRYETSEWRLLLYDYVDVSCVLWPREGTIAPFRWKTRVPVQQSIPLLINFLFAPSNDSNEMENAFSPTSFNNATWASIKEAF